MIIRQTLYGPTGFGRWIVGEVEAPTYEEGIALIAAAWEDGEENQAQIYTIEPDEELPKLGVIFPETQQ